MCEVLKSNFEEYLPSIEERIQKADFIAIDAEFTGLHINDFDKPSLFDTGAERYLMLKKSVSQFMMCQIGISTFVRPDPQKNIYQAHTYNFYLFPSSFGSVNIRFLCEAASLEFLCRHEFDFNKFAYEGISFMNEEQESQLHKEIQGETFFEGVNRSCVDEKVLQEYCSQVAEWSVHAKDGERFNVQCDKEVPEYLLLTELQGRFKELLVYENTNNQLVVEKISGERMRGAKDVEKLGNCSKQQREKIMNDMLGFSRIFKLLVKYKKPLIGHNMLTDLMLMYDKFYRPLPGKCETFKEDIHRMFPCIFDTKHITASLRLPLEETGLLSSTNLLDLYLAFCGEKNRYIVLFSPHVVHAKGFDRYINTHMPHEAAYDAFIAGYVFLKTAHLHALYGKKSTEVKPYINYLEVMSPFQNHVNLIRAAADYLTLDGADPVSRRPQWLFVQSKQTKWQLSSSELAKLFSAYGSVDIRLNGSRQALVAVGNHRCAKDILKAFKNHEKMHVTRYSIWKHSAVVRGMLWSGVLVSGGICLWALLSSYKKWNKPY